MRLRKTLIVLAVLAVPLVVWLSAAASYPTSVKSFATRTAGQTIAASWFNDVQDEIVAIETDLRAGLPVARGGTGLLTGTSGGMLGFTGTTTIASSALLAQHGVMLGGGAGATPATLAPMTTGQLLYGVTGADPLAGQAALSFSTTSNNTGNATGTFKMNGNGSSCAITPRATGRVVFVINGTVFNSTSGSGTQIKLAYGTGAAPANAAAATGTVVGTAQVLTANATQIGFSITTSATGLTLNTAYWFDLQVADQTSGTGTVVGADCTAWEM